MRQKNLRLYRIARGILNDDREAEDVVQKTCLRAFTNLGNVKNPVALKQWLARRAANEALDRLRRRKPAESLDCLMEILPKDESNIVSLPQIPGMENPELTATRREILHLVEAVSENMPMIYRSVFMLRALEGLTTEETGTCLGISREAVKTCFHRARTALHEELKEMATEVSSDVFSCDGAGCDRIARVAREHLLQLAVVHQPW